MYAPNVRALEPRFVLNASAIINPIEQLMVSAGDLDVQSQGVTLINRAGDNLEVRTAPSLAGAQAVTPTVALIESFDSSSILVSGDQSRGDLLVIDLDGWFDSQDASATNFLGQIQFDGQLGFDQVRLIDSDTSNDDPLPSVEYGFSAIDSGSARVAFGDSGDLQILFSGTEQFSQWVTADTVTAQFADFGQQVTISGIASRQEIASATNSASFSLGMLRPEDQLAVRSQSEVVVQDFVGSGLCVESSEQISIEGTIVTSRSSGAADLQLIAPEILATQSNVFAADGIRVVGELDVVGTNQWTSAESIATQAIGSEANGTLEWMAAQDVTVNGSVGGLSSLDIAADETVSFAEDVDVRGDIDVEANTTVVRSASLVSQGTSSFAGQVVFEADTSISAPIFQIDDLSVAANRTVQSFSPLQSNQDELLIRGEGTFALAGSSVLTTPIVVSSGTFRVDGSIAVPQIFVGQRGRLEGSGRVDGEVVGQLGGVIGTGDSSPGGDADATLVLRSLNLGRGRLEVDLNGDQLGLPGPNRVFDQGFEENTDGWFDESNGWTGSVTRVASSADLVSSTGLFHAQIAQTNTPGVGLSGPFTQFDQQRTVFPGQWSAEIDVYLDTTWETGEGFDLAVATSGVVDQQVRDFIFHVTQDTSTGQLLVGASNNTFFDPRENLELGNHSVIDTTGWYRFRHTFRDEGGALNVDMQVINDAGQLVFSETRTDTDDLIGTEIGGNRYGWFTNIDIATGLAIDNVRLDLTSGGSSSGTFDQILLQPDTGGQVNIGGSTLDWTLGFDPNPETEFIIVDNPGSGDVVGRFQTFLDVDGSQLSRPRLLSEGDLVFSTASGAPQDAFITYFGGDGNDIAIVTAGEATVIDDIGHVTLVQRRGVNLEIRTSDSEATVFDATPTIRPIAGLNNSGLSILQSDENDLLIIDVNQFADTSPQAVNFSGTISFGGPQGNGNQDEIRLIDSDVSTNDIFDRVSYQFASLKDGSIELSSNEALPNFTVNFQDTELIDQQIQAERADVTFTEQDDAVLWQRESATENALTFDSRIQPSTRLLVTSPLQEFDLFGSSGDDQFVVQSFADDFQAKLTIDGQFGSDAVDLLSELVLLDVENESLLFRAERVGIQSSIDAQGSIRLVGGNEIVVGNEADLRSLGGSIELDADGGLATTAEANLFANAADGDVVFANASTAVLGNVQTTRLVLDDSSVVTQTADTRIEVAALSGSGSGQVSLSSPTNEVSEVDLQTVGSVSLIDSEADLTVFQLNTGGSVVNLDVNGTLLLANNAIVAEGSTVMIRGRSEVRDLEADDTVDNIVAAEVTMNVVGMIGTADETLDVEASDSIDITTADADIFLANRDGQLPIGTIDVGDAQVQLTADNVQDARDDESIDFAANRLVIDAQEGIGSIRPLELDSVRLLDARSIDGGIRLNWSSSQSMNVQELSTQTGDVDLRTFGGGNLAIQQAGNASENIRIVNQQASILVVDQTALIEVGEDGNLELVAIGTESDVLLQGNIVSAQGNVSISADDDVRLDADASIQSVAGSVALIGDVDRLSGGSVALTDGSIVDAGAGTIEANGTDDVLVANLRSNNVGDAIRVRSFGGAIIDAGDQNLDIEANAGTVILSSQSGIGFENPIETAVDRFIADARSEGGIEVAETDQIDLSSVTTNDGYIDVLAGGTITATELTSTNVSATDSTSFFESHDIRLTTRGAASDVLVGSIHALAGADVSIFVADDVLDFDPKDAGQVVSDDLRIVAENQTVDGDSAIDLTVNVNDLEFAVLSENRGDAEFRETDSLRLASSDVADDLEILQTENGEIRIFAGSEILIQDIDAVNEGPFRLADPEVMAGGDNGRIRLQSADAIEVGNAVQIDASQTTLAAVVLETQDVRLGEEIEINTGDGVGIARVFSPASADAIDRHGVL